MSRMVGGYTEHAIDSISDEFRAVVDAAVGHINGKSNSLVAMVLKEIEYLATQVVAGTNFKMTLKLAFPDKDERHDSRHELVVWRKLNGELQFTTHNVLQ